MSTLRFEWHDAKASENYAKHGVSFDEARTAFSDEFGVVIDDPDHAQGEERFILLAASTRARTLVVVHCLRARGSTVRIISARKASRREQEFYLHRRTT
jgi:uncharacterized DUF497 family protein